MQLPKPVGRDATVRKYDILSALMSYAFSQDKNCQRQVLRLIALITTRYNWKREELTMGQEEIARLWQVDTRTVKREMARFRELGWLRMKRQGARGRVSAYSLNLEEIFQQTRVAWLNIGPDFAERIEAYACEGSAPQTDNVVPLRKTEPPVVDGTLWAQVQAKLYSEDPSCFTAWFSVLKEISTEGACLLLSAPSRFHASYVETQFSERILRHAHFVKPEIRILKIQGGDDIGR